MLSRFKKCLVFAPKQGKNKNINDTFRPLYILVSLVGLFPYSIKYHNQRFIIIHKSIYINVLCAVIIALTITLCVVLHLQLIIATYNQIPLTGVITTQTNHIFGMLILNVFCIVAYISSFLNRFKFVDILNKFAKWTEGPNEESNKILNAIQLKIRFVTGFVILLYMIHIAVNITRTDTYWKMILCHFSTDTPQILQFINISFYYILVSTVGAIISSITDHVKALSRTKPVPNCFMNVDYKASLNLKQLELTYIAVYDVKQDIIKAFQALILITSGQSFHAIVSESHRIYHGLVLHSLSMHDIFNCSVWLIYQIMKIYAVADCGNLLKDEVLKLGLALYNISTEKHDMKLLTEIQHFFTLMNYYGGDLSVYGLFSIDATLVVTVIASAIMYFIVLLQMDEKKIQQ